MSTKPTSRCAPSGCISRAIDRAGDTVEIFFSEHRDLLSASSAKAAKRHGRPARIIIDGSQTDRKAIIACDGESPVTGPLTADAESDRHPAERQYLNNRIEQDQRRIKRRIRSMLGFKSMTCAATILSGIEMVHMMCKGQARYTFTPVPSLAEQFEILAS